MFLISAVREARLVLKILFILQNETLFFSQVALVKIKRVTKRIHIETDIFKPIYTTHAQLLSRQRLAEGSLGCPDNGKINSRLYTS